jgi:hypothetical protein
MKTHNEREIEAALRRSEQREMRVRAAIEEWVTLIDDCREEPPSFDDRFTEFEKTLRMPPKRSERSH